MANSFGPNSWKIDSTANLWDYKTKGPLAIRKLCWLPSAAGQSLLINENSGSTPTGIIWETSSLTFAPAGEQIIEFWDNGKWFDGMTLTTMTAGGVLYVYPE